MDTITQGLLGAAVAELGFRQKLGKGATLAAALAACAPDLDILVARPLRWWADSGDGAAWQTIHRGASHSLIAILPIALIITLLWRFLRKWSPLKRRRLAAGKTVAFDPDDPPGRFGLMFACMAAAVATHGLLDWCTTWGTQNLWPFTRTRYAIDTMPIVDIFYTPILLLTVLGCWLVRRFMTAPKRTTLVIGWIGFLLSLAYVTTGAVLQDTAIDRAKAAIRPPAGYDDSGMTYRAYPQIGTILMWRVTARQDDLWMAARVNFVAGADHPIVWTHARSADNPWVRAARAHRSAASFEWFSQGSTRAEYYPLRDRHVVEFHDMRYGQTPGGVSSMWFLRIEMDATGKVVSAHRNRPGDNDDGRPRPNRREMLARYWRELWNPEAEEAR